MRQANLAGKSRIRNSSLCVESSHIAHLSTFEKERNDQGWNVTEGVSLHGVSGGFMFLSSDGRSPALTRASQFFPIDASIYTEVVIKYRYKRNRSDSIASKGKIQFTTIASTTFTEDNELEFEVYADDLWHTYYVNMGPVQGWIGSITNLKVFFALDGQKDDEIFLSTIKVQAPTFTQCLGDCIESTQEQLFAENLNIQIPGSLPANFHFIDTGSDRTVYVSENPDNPLVNAIALRREASALSGPSILRQGFAPYSQLSMSFRLKLSEAAAANCTLKSEANGRDLFALQVTTSGVQVKAGSDYHTISGAVVSEGWNSLMLDFDGDEAYCTVWLNGTVVASQEATLDRGEVGAVLFSNSSVDPSVVYLDEFICVGISDRSSSCPGLGTQGSLAGQPVTQSRFDVVTGSNDRIVVNINGYGDAVFSLPPVTGADLNEIAAILEETLSALDTGGYPYCEVTNVGGLLKIKSGTYGFDSSVEVKAHSDSPLADQLGFVSAGLSVGVSAAGRPHTSTFSLLNGYRARTSDLRGIRRDGSYDNTVTQDPSTPRAEIGSKSFAKLGRKNAISGLNKTLIDFHHRATEEGRIDTVYFVGGLNSSPEVKATGNTGIAAGNVFIPNFSVKNTHIVSGDVLVINEPGYAGNGSYTFKVEGLWSRSPATFKLRGDVSLPAADNLYFEIHNIAKVKHFRPKLDGTLQLVNEEKIGVKADSALYTRSADSHKLSVSWDVQRGDLIGIYNAKVVFTGNDPKKSVDALYLEVDGDFNGERPILDSLDGQGMHGLGLYGRSTLSQIQGTYDIELDLPQFVEYVEVDITETAREAAYNLMAATGQGASASASVTGTHVHTLFDSSYGLYTKITHPNEYYNLQALIDGATLASNGYMGEFETTVTGAAYFYINGDAEWFLNETVNGISLKNSEEITNQTRYLPISTGEFDDDPFDITLSWNATKHVNKIRFYFKEYPNAESFLLEYLKDDTTSYDGTKVGFDRIGRGSKVEFTQVMLDLKPLRLEWLEETDPFRRHFDREFIGSAGYENPGDGAVLQTFRKMPYTFLEKEFTPVATKAINFHCWSHLSTKISEIEVISTESFGSSPDSILELYFETEGGHFQRAETDIVDGKVRFKVGFPTSRMRLMVEPLQPVTLNKLFIAGSQDFVSYQDEAGRPLNSADIEVEKGALSPAVVVTIQNTSDRLADLELSIDAEELGDSILVKSSLNTEEDILEPSAGPAGILVSNTDFDLPVTKNVAVNCECFSFKNLAEGKPVYVTDQLRSEGDYFFNFVDTTKWESNYANFPQGPSQIGLTYPGFSVARISGSAVPAGNIYAELKAKWEVRGDFNCFITAACDARGANADPMGSGLGLVDSTGRRIYIQKKRVLYRNNGGTTVASSSRYQVIDGYTGSILAEKISYCAVGCGADTGTADDDNQYQLQMNRVVGAGQDLLRFSYTDSLNGAGLPQWDSQPYFEVNLHSLQFTGPLKVFLFNQWNPSSGYYKTGTPGANGSYVQVRRFSFGGSSNFATSYAAFTELDAVGISGTVEIDNRAVSLQQEGGTKYAALDLGRRYPLDVIKNWTSLDRLLWDVTNAEYSNSETANPSLVQWGNSSLRDARWILFSAPVVPFETESNLQYLDKLRIYPDITALTISNSSEDDWVSLGNLLSDGDYTSGLNQVDHPIIAVRLANQFQLADYQLLNTQAAEDTADTPGIEGKDGWYGIATSYCTQSFSLSQSIAEVSWEPWKNYAGTKLIQDAHWFAFQNKTFSLDGSTPTFRVAEFVAETINRSSDDVGQTNDRVDCTEYVEWFDTSYSFEEVVSKVLPDQKPYAGILFGASDQKKFGLLTMGNAYNAFDDNPLTSVVFSGTPCAAWRVFGEVVVGTGGETEQSFDLPNGPAVLVYNAETSYSVSMSGVEIDGFSVSVPADAEGFPCSFSFQKLIAADPTDNASWETIVTAEELCTQTTTEDGVTYYSFNQGETYRYYFSERQTISGARLLVNSYTGVQVDGSISIADFKVFRLLGSQNSNLVSLENDENQKVGGRRSLRLVYKAGGRSSVKLSTRPGVLFEPDLNWSLQDYFSFYLKTDNADIVDMENSYVRFGRNAEVCYVWTLSGTTLSGEFTNVRLKFKDAISKALPEEDWDRPTFEDDESVIDFSTERSGFLQIELALKDQLVEDLSIWVDRPFISRERFELQGINKTLYLNKSELVYFPLTNFDPNKGFFSAVITPDWDYQGMLSPTSGEVFTLFSAMNGVDESISLFYDSRRGLMVVSSSNESRSIIEIGRILTLERYKPIKISLAWDSSGQEIEARANANLRVWINDVWVADYKAEFSFTRTKDSYFFLGSRAFQSDVSIITSDSYPTDWATKLVPKINSLTGGVENLILSSKPVKVEYEELQTLRDKIEVSLDGVNFYTGSDPNLPFILYNVSAGESVDVWVRTNLPQNTSNMARLANLRARWRLH